MGLRVNCDAKVAITDSLTSGLGTNTDSVTLDSSVDYTDGAGVNKAQVAYDGLVTTDENGTFLDLAGVLTNGRGQTITFTKVKGVEFKARSTNTVNALVGPDATNGWLGPFANASDRLTLEPGGSALIQAPSADGWAVTAGSLDELFFAAAVAGTINVDVVIWGEGTLA